MRKLLFITFSFLTTLVYGQQLKIQDTIHVTEFVSGQKINSTKIMPDTNYVVLLNPKDNLALSMDELYEIKKILKKCINDNKTLLFDYTKYKRQYSVYKDKNGDKIVHVNCFCGGASRFKDWKKQLVIVDDGGKCFFNIKINLKAKKYSDLDINGEA
jgi:hypothetical protein